MNASARDSLSVAPKKFDRFGDSHYLRIDSAEALRQVLALPEARWFASNAPVEAFRTDPQFLGYLNQNQDGRLRPHEVKAAISWTLRVFGRLSDDAVGSRRLVLEHLKQDSEEGRQVLAAARIVTALYGKKNAREVQLADVDRVRKQVDADGLGVPGHVRSTVDCSERCARLIADIMTVAEPSDDLIREEDLEVFLGLCREVDKWENELETGDAGVWLPFGEDTPELYEIYAALHDRLEAFFTLCQLVKVSPQIKALVNQSESSESVPDLGKRDAVAALAQNAPIAAINSDSLIKFNGAVNPADSARLIQFRDRIFAPLFETTSQSFKRDHWEEVKARFAVYHEWMGRRPTGQVVGIESPRRREYLGKNSGLVELRRLFAESRENVQALASVALLEKAILFQAHLLAFANNYVSCPDLFAPAGRALFEMGTLILDGREFTFCVHVPDKDRHVRRCRGEHIFVIYAAISDADGQLMYEVATPLTSGLRGHLQEGQWGVFHDSLGREYNAQVTQLLESPISLWAGLVAPFQRLVKAAFLRLDSLSLEAESVLRERLLEGRGAPRISETSSSGSFSRSFLASGVLAAAALGAAGAYMARTLADTDLSRLFWASVALVTVVVLPLMVSTAWRLRNRDLRCLLEGANWGINIRMRLTPTLARTFTRQRRI